MPADETLGQAKLATRGPHFVLEEFAQGFDELHAHPLGQAPDIVVALDRDRRAAGERDALDHVRVEGALRQKIDRPAAVARNSARLGLERVDEEPADGLALGFRVLDAFERADELPRRVDVGEGDVEVAAEEADDLLGLALAH